MRFRRPKREVMLLATTIAAVGFGTAASLVGPAAREAGAAAPRRVTVGYAYAPAEPEFRIVVGSAPSALRSAPRPTDCVLELNGAYLALADDYFFRADPLTGYVWGGCSFDLRGMPRPSSIEARATLEQSPGGRLREGRFHVRCAEATALGCSGHQAVAMEEAR